MGTTLSSLTNVARLGQGASPSITEVLDVVCDHYPTGGFALDLAARYPDMTIRSVRAEGRVTSSGDPSLRRFTWQATTKKLFCIKADGSAEETNNTDLSTVTVQLIIHAE